MASTFYVDGYLYGQHDVLTWLTPGTSGDDWPLAAFDERAQFRAAMVCLGMNLRIVAFGCVAFREGCDHRMRMMLDVPIAEDWSPGCGRPIPTKASK